MNKPSLNQLVLDALTSLQAKRAADYVTARQVKDWVDAACGRAYPIQTIILVLNRFEQRGRVHRLQFADPVVRERYGYYLVDTHTEEDRMWERFKAFADEFFKGDARSACQAAEALVSKHCKAG